MKICQDCDNRQNNKSLFCSKCGSKNLKECKINFKIIIPCVLIFVTTLTFIMIFSNVDSSSKLVKTQIIIPTTSPTKRPQIDFSNIFQIHYIEVSDPDSADGVDVKISYTNLKEEPIKYVTFIVTPYNVVGDVTESSIDGETTKSIKVVGEYKKHTVISWENVWYNPTITSAETCGILITYMNDEFLYINKEDFNDTLFNY